LLGAAQLWRTLTQLVQFQSQIMKPFLTLQPKSHWLDGVQDPSSTIELLTDALQRLNLRVESFHQLEQNADVLIQRITNLISIDEGYRSRDQNASLNRLSWITVSFGLQH
jgi:Mg2+ and Co2+ transporter CorA